MNKESFLVRLREALSGLPRDDAEERLAFYNELIDDRVADGLSEEDAVAELGSAEEIASQLLAETPLTRLVRERIRPTRRLRVWEILLLILGFPLWLSLLAAAFAVLLAVHIVIWSVILTLWAAVVALLISALAILAAGILTLYRSGSAQGLVMISGGVVLVGLSIFLFLGCRAVTRGASRLTERIALGVKSLFLRKESAK